MATHSSNPAFRSITHGTRIIPGPPRCQDTASTRSRGDSGFRRQSGDDPSVSRRCICSLPVTAGTGRWRKRAALTAGVQHLNPSQPSAGPCDPMTGGLEAVSVKMVPRRAAILTVQRTGGIMARRTDRRARGPAATGLAGLPPAIRQRDGPWSGRPVQERGITIMRFP
jgi:hypothetical protein